MLKALGPSLIRHFSLQSCYLYAAYTQVMVATVRCEEIANEKFASFIANEVKCLDTVSRFNPCQRLFS